VIFMRYSIKAQLLSLQCALHDIIELGGNWELIPKLNHNPSPQGEKLTDKSYKKAMPI